MTVLELSFPAGRYHATPWGRHVNEGAVEWPPSPWRLARALIATWHLKAREIPREVVRSLLDKLSTPPAFHLPRSVASHTRHYMPLGDSRDGTTTKIFDTFIHLPQGKSIYVQWEVDLSGEERTALATLAIRLGYFGRAESLVLAQLCDELPKNAELNVRLLLDGEKLPEKHEGVRLLCPMTPGDYDKWRGDFLAKATPPEAAKKAPKKSAKRAAAVEVPADLFEALHADTGDLQGAGWNLPPGARFMTYARLENALAPEPKKRVPPTAKPPTVARYSLTSAVPPRITKAILIADDIHEKLCSLRVPGLETCPQVLRGTNDDRVPLKDHKHAHIFCEANGPGDVISHVTIWAPMGFDPDACRVLRSFNEIPRRSGHHLRFVLHGLGEPDEFAESPLFEKSATWRSLTPFVSTRHEKRFRDGRPKINPTNGKLIGSAEEDLLRLLAQDPATARGWIRWQNEFIPVKGRRLRCLQYQTFREGGGSRGAAVGSSFSLEFPEKVAGPLAFGYGSHFGLGLFVPEK